MSSKKNLLCVPLYLGNCTTMGPYQLIKKTYLSDTLTQFLAEGNLHALPLALGTGYVLIMHEYHAVVQNNVRRRYSVTHNSHLF